MSATRKEESVISREIRIIPWWAYALAVALFVGVQTFVHFYGFRRMPSPPPFPLRIFITVMGGCIVAFLALLVGYVNRDAKRRNMNAKLWTVLVIFIPNAIGFILYFLLRQPLMVKCPQCATTVNPSFNYCPQCKYNLRPTCPQCQHTVSPGDIFCPYCARELEKVAREPIR